MLKHNFSFHKYSTISVNFEVIFQFQEKLYNNIGDLRAMQAGGSADITTPPPESEVGGGHPLSVTRGFRSLDRI